MTADHPHPNHILAGEADSYYSQDRLEMLDFVPTNVQRVLEVGCGAGEFAESIRVDRPHVIIWGVEPAPEAANIAAGRLDKIICSSIEAGIPELVGQKFDCVVFNDVLEHLVDPEKVLRETRQYLTEGGVIVASIPNILYFYEITKILITEDWEYQDYGTLDKTHLRFFTRKSIMRLFRSAGYEIHEIRGINAFAGKKFRIANLLTLGRLSDWKFVQFGIRAGLAS
jgi:2-polyprenyl-3-methyl-5-hydroxy-6-metoxy-1,4-benzoquinol methylase